MKKKSFTDLDKDTLCDLLKLCAEPVSAENAADPNQRRSELLEDMLAEPLSRAGHTSTSMSEHLDSICELSGLDNSVSIREFLLQPETDIAILQRIRKHGKNLTRKDKSTLEQELGGVIYSAAIASAIVFHDEKISKLSEKQLLESFSALINTPWMPSDLMKLFKNACKRLEP